MNSALPTMVISTGLPFADLQSYRQSALSLAGRLVSATQAWVRAWGGLQQPVVIATGTVAAVLLLLLVCVIFLYIRARRETRRFREELADLVTLTQSAESANEAKAEFLVSMSHRIRTPMNAIVSFTDLALKTDLDSELREYLDTVRTSADWLMHIANDVLEFSRMEAGQPHLDNVPFSISECIRSAMKIVEREASAKKLVLSCKIDPQLPEVVGGDPARLRHVIFNLLDYAVRCTTSGSVVLSAAVESNSADDVLVRVAVTNAGVGISPPKQPFTTADAGAPRKNGATGVGLGISRRLVDLMGGTMEFPSQGGAGGTFEFTARFQKQKTAAVLDAPVRSPKTVEPAETVGPKETAGAKVTVRLKETVRPKETVSPKESVALKELSILLAEDNAANRHLITEVLESAGHRVWTAANGKETTHNVKTQGFDLILLDIEMPDNDNLEVTRGIRAGEAPNLHVPIYALTAHTLPSDRDRCLAAGMDGLIAKPIAADEVLQLVSELAGSTAKTGGAHSALAPEDKAPVADANEYALPPEPSSSDSGTMTRNRKPAATPRPDFRSIAIDFAENVFTPEYVEQEIPTASDIARHGMDSGHSSVDSDDAEFALEAILSNPAKAALDIAGKSDISEADKTSSTDFLHDQGTRNPDPSPYLPARVADAETNRFSGAKKPAVNVEMEEASDVGIASGCDIAIHAAGKLLIADSEEADSKQDVLRHVNRSATISTILAPVEASPCKSDDSGPAANLQLSAPAGLALLEAASQMTHQSPSPAKKNDDSTPTPAWNPFEQARKSLSKSRFDVRVIHNDGDPSDRNLI